MKLSEARIIFLGTSAYAEPVLRTLCDHDCNVVLVVSQPDRKKGRRRKKASPPVKQCALDLGIDVFQPEKIRSKSAFETLQSYQPDIMITASYGQILRKKHIELPRYGILNVHASLLPVLRGAAPIQYSIIRGYDTTGVTIMKTDVGIDTGPILSLQDVPINPDDTAGSLEEKLSITGARLLIDTLPGYLAGEIDAVPQDETKATHAPMLYSEDGRIDWSRSAIEIARQVRGMNPCPGAFTLCHNQRLKIHFASAWQDHTEHLQRQTPGTIIGLVKNKGITVQTGDGLLLIEEIQPACKRRMPAYSLIQGRYVEVGYQFEVGEQNSGDSGPCPE